eukprot:CAMPEP_0119411308 /NCGR_PEP_ID=MMETSP1335-20130426/4088_1 /TAXON_ID=259385 /ORGANISM="Chrysoculter rhomboideus, Strain RCC1486" /LENGTH=104 /DNA_ID=CAMNT_0007435931 /DNA_START=45 /DNA_END=356 /DNA_ORIENTATION=-
MVGTKPRLLLSNQACAVVRVAVVECHRGAVCIQELSHLQTRHDGARTRQSSFSCVGPQLDVSTMREQGGHARSVPLKARHHQRLPPNWLVWLTAAPCSSRADTH